MFFADEPDPLDAAPMDEPPRDPRHGPAEDELPVCSGTGCGGDRVRTRWSSSKRLVSSPTGSCSRSVGNSAAVIRACERSSSWSTRTTSTPQTRIVNRGGRASRKRQGPGSVTPEPCAACKGTQCMVMRRDPSHASRSRGMHNAPAPLIELKTRRRACQSSLESRDLRLLEQGTRVLRLSGWADLGCPGCPAQVGAVYPPSTRSTRNQNPRGSASSRSAPRTPRPA